MYIFHVKYIFVCFKAEFQESSFFFVLKKNKIKVHGVKAERQHLGQRGPNKLFLTNMRLLDVPYKLYVAEATYKHCVPGWSRDFLYHTQNTVESI